MIENEYGSNLGLVYKLHIAFLAPTNGSFCQTIVLVEMYSCYFIWCDEGNILGGLAFYDNSCDVTGQIHPGNLSINENLIKTLSLLGIQSFLNNFKQTLENRVG